jgi:hypothetical protein
MIRQAPRIVRCSRTTREKKAFQRHGGSKLLSLKGHLSINQTVSVYSVKLLTLRCHAFQFFSHACTLLQGSRATAASTCSCQYGSSRSRKASSRSLSRSLSLGLAVLPPLILSLFPDHARP